LRPGSALVDEGDRRGHRAHEREGLQVDAIDTEPGLARRFDELVIMSRWAATMRTFCLATPSSPCTVART
jgi:hypothetical protein